MRWPTLAAAWLVVHPGASSAQQGAAAADIPPVAVVGGVAPGDLLNVRAAASPTGKVVGRLDNGSLLRTDGCDEVNGYRWCRVDAVGRDDVAGWAPARYLLPASAAEAETALLETEPSPADEAAQAEAAGGEAPPTPAGALAPPTEARWAASAPSAEMPVELARAAAAPPAKPEGDRLAVVPPPDLTERLGDAAEEVVALDPQRDLIARLEQDAAQAALSLAFTADDDPPTGEIFSPLLDGGDEPAVRDAVAAVPPVAAVTQVRAPRLERPTLAQAQVPASAPAADAVSEVPCARYIGQPMGRCEASVARVGADAAEVTVTLPDGGARVIRFRDGKPEGSNSRGEFRFTREGDLNMIRVGLSERFEIPDSLAFGD